jgi:hypothetical protein
VNFSGVERPDPIRPLFLALVEAVSGAARSQATDLLKRYDVLMRASESWRSSGPGALRWLAAVDELLADGEHIFVTVRAVGT